MMFIQQTDLNILLHLLQWVISPRFPLFINTYSKGTRATQRGATEVSIHFAYNNIEAGSLIQIFTRKSIPIFRIQPPY